MNRTQHEHIPAIVRRIGGLSADEQNRCKECGQTIFRDPARGMRWIASADIEPVAAEADRVNVYTCEKCGGYTVTIDVHQGVTPFMIGCRATGSERECDGTATSSFYPKGPRPPWIPDPSWEWFRPTGLDYRKLSDAMQEHVDKGGLDLRPRRSVAPTP